MRAIAPFAAWANVAIFVSIAIVLVHAGMAYERFGGSLHRPLARPDTAPLFFGAVVYTYEGINSVLPVENALARPERMLAVLYAGMGVVSFMYVSVAVFAFTAFPSITSGSVTAAMASYFDGPVVAATNVLVSLAVVLTFPVQLLPAIQILERASASRSPARRARAPAAARRGRRLRPLSAATTRADDDEAVAALVDEFSRASGEIELPPSAADDGAPGGGAGGGRAARGRRRATARRGGRRRLQAMPMAVSGHGAIDAAAAAPPPREKRDEVPMTTARVAFRIGVVAATGAAAASIPDLGALLALVGSVTGAVLTLIIPSIINLRVFGRELPTLELFLTGLGLSLGVVGGIWGTAMALVVAVRGDGPGPAG